MQKITIHSVPSEDQSRHDFLVALEKLILKQELSQSTATILSIRTLSTNQKSLLFRLLDKGVIYRIGDTTGDWSKGFSMNMDEVATYFIDPYSITVTDIEKAFEEVNKYLEGFNFLIAATDTEWSLWYSSDSFNKSAKEYIDTIFDKSETR